MAAEAKAAQSSDADEAAAFLGEASELGQAKLQQDEFVEEGTGGRGAAEQEKAAVIHSAKDEL